MKRHLTLFIVLLNLNLVNAQVISDTVRFNNYVSPTNNDLVNHFSNTSWIMQDSIHGITGGALNTPNTLSWGNDLIWYCKQYSNVIDSMMTTSICFIWNGSLINTNTYDRAAAIFYEGNAINHNISFYLNRDRTTTIITYGSVNNSAPLTLVNGNWYRLTGSFKCESTAPGDWLTAHLKVDDLGFTGTANPTLVMALNSSIQDSDMVNSPEFNVRICGAKWGGGAYLDNFIFNGIPGTINCATTGVNSTILNNESINVYPQPANEVMYVSINGTKREKSIFYSMTDIAGREVMQGEKVMNDVYSLDVHLLLPGIYFLRVKNGAQLFSKKIIID